MSWPLFFLPFVVSAAGGPEPSCRGITYGTRVPYTAAERTVSPSVVVAAPPAL